jgi:hypothetical protein
LNACATWPDDPSLIANKPACTYKFEWIE